MFRHVVLFRFTPESTADQRRAMIDGLAELPAAIPEIRSYRIGPDVAETEGNWDAAIVADFDSVDAWRVYRDHPLHQRRVSELVRPIVTDRAAVQLEL